MQANATLDSALRQAQDALRQSQPESALAITAELIDAYPDAVRVWRTRAEALEAAGQHDAAAEAHARVLDALPSDALALGGCARALAAANRALEAADMARHALDHTPDDARLRDIARLDVQTGMLQYGVIDLARGQAQAGEFNRGIGKLRRLIETQPTRADARLALAEMLWKNSVRHVAAELCNALLTSHPNALAAHGMLMALARRGGQIEIERTHAAVIARLDPDRREINTLLEASSPLRIEEAPVEIAQQLPLVEDEETSSAWVNELIASSTAAPRPNSSSVANEADVIDAVAVDAGVIDAKEATAVGDLDPLDWRNDETKTDVDDFADNDHDVAIDIIAGPEANLTDADESADTDDSEYADDVMKSAYSGTIAPADAIHPHDMHADAGATVDTDEIDEIEEIDDVVDTDEINETDETDESDETEETDDDTGIVDAALAGESDGDARDGDRDLPLPRIINAPGSRLVTDEGIEVEPLSWSQLESPASAAPAKPSVDGERGRQTAPVLDAPGPIPGNGAIAALASPQDDRATVGVIESPPRPARRKPWQMPDGATVNTGATATVALPVADKPPQATKTAGKPEDVLETARQALEANQLDMAATCFDQLIQRGKRLDDVISALDAATQAHPASRRLFEALGNAHTRKGNMPAALDAYRKALAAL